MDDRITDEPTERIRALEQSLGTLQVELAECRAQARSMARDLGERVKELSCLYAVASLLQPATELDEVMPGVLQSLAAAYQYPEITSACVRLEGKTYCTEGFQQTHWRQAAVLSLDSKIVGTLEIFYREERPEAGEGPFLTEERHLIDAVAVLLTRYLQRKGIEDALHKSERKYRALVDNLYEGIWLIDKDNNTTFVNARLVELLGGYSIEEMQGRNIFTFLDRESKEVAKRSLALGRTGSRAIYESRLRRKDGMAVWTRIATTPLFDDRGYYAGALAGVIDISEQKRAEAALRESEERFRRQANELETIYWWAPIGLAVLDDQMRFLRVNRRLAEMNGPLAEEHIGKTIHEIIPAVAAQAELITRRLVETGEPILNVEFQGETPALPGVERFWNEHWLPLKDSTGRVWGINVVVEEITERKRAQEDLSRREQEFEALAERSPDIIARIDRNHRLLYINPAVERVTGRQRDWFVGKRFEEVGLSPEEAALRKKSVQQVFELGEEQVLEHTHPSSEGDYYFQSSLVPEFGRDGKVESVLVVDRDFTALKRVQQALERLTLQDPLTGVANRRYLEQFVELEWRQEARHRHTVALVMADIDHFKAYNDHYGHPQGDECLRQVAQALKVHLRRPTDLLARYGGEEFLIVLPETNLEEARRLAEKMRQTVAEKRLDHAASPVSSSVTVSLGVVAAPARSYNFQALLASVDQALYKAKKKGRNRVEVWRNP